MAWAFYVIIGVVFFASLAMMVREGLWSNAVLLANIVFSGLVAFGFYAPLTIMIDEALDGQFTYVLDFLMLWGLFVLTMIVLRTVTDRISRTRLRTKYPIDAIGGPAVGVIAAFVMTSFVMATMHTAPLAKDCLGGKLVHTEAEVESKSGLTAPDLFWLRLVERVGTADGFGGAGTLRFTVAGWVEIYAEHRGQLEKAGSLKVRRG